MNCAIVENGIVVNVIYVSRKNRGEFENCYPIGRMPVMIGDEYRDGKYYRNGQEITIGG